MVSPTVSRPPTLALVDLARQYRRFKKDLNRACQEVLASGYYIQGPQYDAFKKEFADFCQTSYCVPVANGTDAIHLVLKVLGIGSGDEVIVPAMTFIATAETVANIGAKPVFVDVMENSFCMDPSKIKEKISEKTKAILPVHLYGHPADLDPIFKIAKDRSLWVIEDACQAHGAKYHGRRAGSMGIAGCFSFYPAKNLGCFGDGGAIVTQDAAMAKRLARVANHGSLIKYQHEELGINSRLDEIQAAMLRIKLRSLDHDNNTRRQWAALYTKLLTGVGDLILPKNSPDCESVYHLYVVRTQRRQELHDYLRQQGIMAQVHYPDPLHLLEAFRPLGYRPGSFPVAEKLCREVLSLPLFAELKKSEVERVAKTIRTWFKKI